MPTDAMPSDAELRSLFHGASAPPSSLDAATIIRRSKRRRLPQQLGAGSVLTLAAAGIGVAGINGIQGLAPMSASQTAADAPAGVSEGAPVPWSATDSVQGERAACETGGDVDVDTVDGLSAAPSFPATASSGELVSGTITVTNTGTELVHGTIFDSLVTLSRGDVREAHRNIQAADTSVELAPGESVAINFAFNASSCEVPGAPLESGQYDLIAFVTLETADGMVLSAGGEASAITLR
jgi:hypothetical protein